MKPPSLPAQQAVHRLVIEEGGYPPPKVSAHLIVRDVQELIGNMADGGRYGPTQIALLTEAFINSLKLANQFSSRLERAYREAGLPLNLRRIEDEGYLLLDTGDGSDAVLGRLLDQAKVVSALIDYYMSPLCVSMSRPSSVPLYDEILHLHVLMFKLAAIHGVALQGSFRQRIEAPVRVPSLERFDPARADSVQMFAAVRDNTHCPFAGEARLWGTPAFNSEATLADNVLASVPLLSTFICVARAEDLDGFLYAFPTSEVGGANITSLCVVVKTLVQTLMESDSLVPRELTSADASEKDWRFAFGGEDFFVNVFAPFYPHSHSRYTYGAGGGAYLFIMLQPDCSFHRRIPEENFHVVRNQIRERFERNYQYYELDDVEAHRFILGPRSHEIIRWYSQ